MGGPFFQFDLRGTRRIVDTVRRSEATAAFTPDGDGSQFQGDGVLMPFQVVSVPASTYVICQPYNFNGSNSSLAPYNFSVAVITSHAVGDKIYAIAVGCSLQHLADANGVPVLLQEVGGGAGSVIPVLLNNDGGYDGVADEYLEATWTYTATNINTGAVYATNLPLFGHRQIAQQTTFATFGLIGPVGNPAIIGYGGEQDVLVNDGTGFGYPPGYVAGSGSGYTIVQPWRLFYADEQFPLAPCDESTGSGD